MNDRQREALKRLIQTYTREKTASREIARQSLIEEGIYEKDGSLAPEYGGEGYEQRTLYSV